MANPSAIFTTGQTNDPRLFYQTGGSFSQISSPQQLQQLASQGVVQVGGQRQTLPQSYLSTLNPTPSPAPSPTPTPATPVPSATPSTTSTQPTRPLEVAPGVFSLSRLTDFYNNQTEKMRPIYEQAQQNLQSLNQQFTDLKAPNLRQEKDALFAQQVTPLDTKIAEKTAALTSYDDALRGIEDAVRAEVGGRASEAVIRAEIARRARPLELQRQTALQEIQGLEGQRNRVVQNISSSLELGIADYETQVNRINTQRQLANDAVNSFNSLVEKGAAATDKERDDFRSIVSTLIQSTPDVLQSLTSDEYTQLERGFLSQSVLNKITNTIKEKELAQKEANQKLDTSVVEVNGNRVLVNNQTGATISVLGPATPSAGQYDVVQDQKTGNFYRINKLTGQAEPVTQGGSTTPDQGGSTTPDQGGSIAYRTNNPGNIKYSAFTASLGATDSGIKATDGGTFAQFPSYEAGKQAQISLLRSSGYANLTVDQAMKRWSNNGYGANIVSGQIAANKKIKDLSDAEMSTLQAAMQKIEGYTPPTQFSTSPKQDESTKPLSGEASKLMAITETIVPEIEQLKKAFRDDYRGALTGIITGTNRKLVKLVDNVADKVGRLRSGGAVNTDEAARFKNQIVSIGDAAFGNVADAVAALDGLMLEANEVRNGISGKQRSPTTSDPLGISSAGSDPLGIR